MGEDLDLDDIDIDSWGKDEPEVKKPEKQEKPKEECPYCGNEFSNLKRHKCPQDPKNEPQKTVDVKDIINKVKNSFVSDFNELKTEIKLLKSQSFQKDINDLSDKVKVMESLINEISDKDEIDLSKFTFDDIFEWIITKWEKYRSNLGKIKRAVRKSSVEELPVNLKEKLDELKTPAGFGVDAATIEFWFRLFKDALVDFINPQ